MSSNFLKEITHLIGARQCIWTYADACSENNVSQSSFADAFLGYFSYRERGRSVLSISYGQ